MIPDTFNDLRVEFDTAIDIANHSGDLGARKALINHARGVLNQARESWQEELGVLRGMLQSLRSADTERIRLAAREERDRPIHRSYEMTAPEIAGK